MSNSTDKYKLIIFDLDGTLADRETGELLEGVAEWFAENKAKHDFAITSNQGGVGLRHWMEVGGFGNPQQYPTEDEVIERAEKVRSAIGLDALTPILFAFRYLTKKGVWSPIPPDSDGKRRSDNEDDWLDTAWDKEWRKPSAGMFFVAMGITFSPDETLMVGDRPEDEQAAAKAGLGFMWAWEFFERDKPESESP